MHQQQSKCQPDSFNSKTQKQLDIYIRNNKKQAILIHTQQSANLNHISNAIHSRFAVPPSDQILFYNGIQITPSEETKQLKLQDKSIIHMVDRRNVTPQLTINVRRLNVPTMEQFHISSSDIIQDFIIRNIQEEEPSKMFFVYTGRQLNKRKSFGEEFVESDSQLFCLHQSKDQVKGEKREKYQKRIKKQKKHERGRREKLEDERSSGAVESEEKKQEISEKNQLQNQKVTQIKNESGHMQNQNKDDKAHNFKKKNKTQQINLGVGNSENVFQPQGSNIEGNNSLFTQQNLQQNKQKMGQSGFFNDGSSISSIMAEEHHNPQSVKRQESSLFQSAYIGLNIQNQNNQSQRIPSSTNILGPVDQNSVQSKQESVTFTYENRAPQQIYIPDQIPSALKNDKIQEVDESQEDYSQSKSMSIAAKKNDSKENDLFGEGLLLTDRIQHHHLNASAQLQVQLDQQKQSPMKPQQSKPMINQNQLIDQSNQKMEYIGVQIQPIEHTNHNMHIASNRDQYQQIQKSISCSDSKSVNTPYFDQPTPPVQLYIIEQQPDTVQGGISSVGIEEKDQVQTNGGRSSGSQAFSRASSRVKQINSQQNQYDFGQFQKCFNANRYSVNRQTSQKDENQQQLLESSHSQIYKLNRYNSHQSHSTEQKQIITWAKNNQQEEQSLQISEQLPSDAKFKESSLLIDGLSNMAKPFRQFQFQKTQNQKINDLQRNQFIKQASGIDELNYLFSKLKPAEPCQHQNSAIQKIMLDSPKESLQKIQLGKQEYVQSLQSMYKLDKNREKQFLDVKLNKIYKNKINQNGQEMLQTSLNQKLTFQNKTLKTQQLQVAKQIIIDSAQSLQRMQVKISNNGTSFKASECEFKANTQKQYYNIGNYIYCCQFNVFNPLKFYINSHNHLEIQIANTYP